MQYESPVLAQPQSLPQSLSRAGVLPYIEINGVRTVPDDVILHIFQKLQSDKTLSIVFYDGSVRTEDQFLNFIKSPMNCVCFGIMDGSISGLAWLNDINDGRGTAHFCVFKESWGKNAKLMAKEVMDYWFALTTSTGKPLFHLILGVTPSNYKPALRFVSQIGFTLIGEVPKVLFNAYSNSRINAILSYCERP